LLGEVRPKGRYRAVSKAFESPAVLLVEERKRL
jgi:hypothetical protein